MSVQQTVAVNPNRNNPYASASLYVGDLAPAVNEATLFELFNAVGPVASIRVCRDGTTQRSLGYAYVNFHSAQDAARSLDSMNFTNIYGKQCRIMWSQRDPKLRDSGKGNIFVKNLHESIDNKTLYDTFSIFGNILSCKVVIDRNTQKSRGYGYVHYIDAKSAANAIKGVNGMKICDREVYAELFKPREERVKSFKFTNVYVKYIPRGFSIKQLIELFEQETGGKIDAHKYWVQEFGVSACLNFENYQHAKLAVEKLNGKNLSSEVNNEEKEENKEENKEESANGDGDNTTSNKEKMKEVVENKALFVTRAQKRKERDSYLRKNKNQRYGQLKQRNYSGANLYVKNLPLEYNDDKLKEMFSSYGKITSAKVMREGNSNDERAKSRGFGFVAFERKEDAARALSEMKNTTFHGDKPLYVSKAQSKQSRRYFLLTQLRNRRMHPQQNKHMGGGNRGNAQQNYNNQNRVGYQQQQFHQQNTQQNIKYGYNQQQQFAAQQRFNSQQMRGGYNIPNMLYSANPMLRQQQILLNQNIVRTNNVSNVNPHHPSVSHQISSRNVSSIGGSNVNANIGSTSNIGVNPSTSMYHANLTSGPTGVSSIPQSQLSQNQQQSAPMLEIQPLTAEMLKGAKQGEKKRLIGERLFPKIQVVEPRLAGKITGMLLEMDNTELLVLLDDQKALMNKINEALAVLKDHQQKQSQHNSQQNRSASGQNQNSPSSQNN